MNARDRLLAYLRQAGLSTARAEANLDAHEKAWRERAGAAEREVAAARKYAAEMRDFCSPHGVSVHYAEQLVEAMDRARKDAL